MPNLQRYTSLPVDHRDGRTPRLSLFKWFYRRYVRTLWFPGPWSANCLLALLVTFVLFMFLSTHLYMGLQEQAQIDGTGSGGGAFPELRNGSSKSTAYRLRIPFMDSPAKMEAARQIDRQLEKIEQSLQENREILKQIRANIHEAELKKAGGRASATGHRNLTSSQDDASDYFDSIRLMDALFYPTHSPLHSTAAFCDNSPATGQYSQGDVNMGKVYETVPFDNPDGGVWKQGWELTGRQEDFAPGSRAKLKIVVVPHSHNDPGWVKTFDTYFREQTKSILTSAVEQLNAHPEMRFIWAEASYMSAWWETAPSDQHRDLMKQLVKEGRLELVTGGWVMNDEANTHYFSMISQMIEGHEWLRDTFPGVRMKHGWAIDPFGLSSTMAYLLKRMGFEGMVIQRVHYSIKKYLAKHKELEFRWRQHWEPESSDRDILCHVEPFYSYDVPHTCGPDPAVCCQFDFKRLPGTRVKCPWKIAPKAITDSNVEERAKTLLDQYRKKSQLYKTNVLMVPLGDDFRFDKVKEWEDQFNNYKKLMDYMNGRADMNVEIKFGTLTDYFNTVYNDTGALHRVSSSFTSGDTYEFDHTHLASAFPSLVGDFFTYSDRDDHYWSGYYTSKPFYKRFERVLESYLRATEILFSIANVALWDADTDEDPFKEVMSDFIYARQNLALFQHHDGITGTAKDFVVKDYAKRMYHAFKILERIASASMLAISANLTGNQFALTAKDPSLNLEFMDRFPNDETPTRKRIFNLDFGSKHYFVLYNSLGWTQESQVFCFEVTWTGNGGQLPTDWCLTQTGSGKIIDDLQINHVWSMDSLVHGRREICFQPLLGPVSLEQYCVGKCAGLDDSTSNNNLATLYQKKESFVTLYNYHEKQESTVPTGSHILSMVAPPPKNLTIENERIQLRFNADTGLLEKVALLDPTGTERWVEIDASMKVMTYGTKPGPKSVPKSGAYIFLPDEAEPKSWSGYGKPKIRVMNGRIESRYELIYTEPLPVYIRLSLYRGRRSVDLQTEFQLQGLYGANKELLLRFTVPQIENEDRFFTDLNGFQMISRKRFAKIPVQGNVYPLNTLAWIENGDDSGEDSSGNAQRNLRFNILTGQPLGVTSSKPGTMDVFLDRRLTQDDARGLNQGVIDNKRTRENFRLLFEWPAPASDTSPRLTSAALFESQSLLNPIFGLTSSGEGSSSGTAAILPETPNSLHFLKHSLPCDVHLLNLRRATKRTEEVGILLHRFGLSCDSTCATTTSGSGDTITSGWEISLDSIFPESFIQKFEQDRVVPHGISLLDPTTATGNTNFQANLTIEPMEIVAYKMYLKKDQP